MSNYIILNEYNNVVLIKFVMRHVIHEKLASMVLLHPRNAV